MSRGTASSPAMRRQRLWRMVGIAFAYGLLVVAGAFAADWLVDLLNMELKPTTEPLMHRIIMSCLVAYVLLMALPFVPGVEIGLALIFMLGPEIVPVVYLATVTALVVSYGIGRLVPDRLLVEAFTTLGLTRAAALVQSLEPLGVEERVALLVARAPSGMASWLVRRRHWAIAATLNIPGNNLIGGSGGIALVAGLGRLVSFPAFVSTVALGTAPVPLAVLAWHLLG